MLREPGVMAALDTLWRFLLPTINSGDIAIMDI